MVRRSLEVGYRSARKLVVAVVGLTVLLVGVAMIALPGPAIVVMPLGLGILGLEFAWARRLLRDAQQKTRSAYSRLRGAGTT